MCPLHFIPVTCISDKPLPHTFWQGLNRRRKGSGRGLTSHRIGTGHEVQRDGVGWMGGHALQVALRDFVQAEGGGGHVLIHPVQEWVHAWFLGLPQLQVPSRALAVFAASLHVLRVARQSSWKKEREAVIQPFMTFLTPFIRTRFPIRQIPLLFTVALNQYCAIFSSSPISNCRCLPLLPGDNDGTCSDIWKAPNIGKHFSSPAVF